MSLSRQEYARNYINPATGAFVKRIVFYEGVITPYKQTFQTLVLAAAVPPSPTDGDINTVADAAATLLYNTWVSGLDPSLEQLKPGQSGIVVP